MRGQPHELRAVEHEFFGLYGVVFFHPVAIAIVHGFKRLKRFGIGHLWCRIATPCGERYSDVKPCILYRLFHTDITRQYDGIGNADAKFTGNRFKHVQYFRQAFGFVAFPIFLRCEANACAVCPAASV